MFYLGISTFYLEISAFILTFVLNIMHFMKTKFIYLKIHKKVDSCIFNLPYWSKINSLEEKQRNAHIK